MVLGPCNHRHRVIGAQTTSALTTHAAVLYCIPSSKSKIRTKYSEATVNVELLFIGNSSVWKSSLIQRFSDEKFLIEDESGATVGVDFRVHKMEVNSRKVKPIIWVCDTIFQSLNDYVIGLIDNHPLRHKLE